VVLITWVAEALHILSHVVPPLTLTTAAVATCGHPVVDGEDSRLDSRLDGGFSDGFDVLSLARPCRVAADDLNLLGGKLVSAFALELHVFDEEGPHVVAEAVSF
jgi:hypothetical protein